ncbi:MAG: riboflavin synthase [Proteobacteria bacterium]|nr:MAG: riboflavin synthase [Pseudomonadota bacterium]
MFTGIIEEIGSISSIQHKAATLTITIHANKVLQDVKLGDSIAVNGVCLTVTSFTKNSFTVDVMPVTYHDTTLATLNNGSPVNLERAMAANGRFGGHVVSGHIDGVGTISNKVKTGNAILYTINLDKNLALFCIKKGSIAIDGTSLTIVDVTMDSVQVSIIPHTQSESIIGNKTVGDRVNLECDIMAKQVAKFNSNQPSSNISADFLREHGFL